MTQAEHGKLFRENAEEMVHRLNQSREELVDEISDDVAFQFAWQVRHHVRQAIRCIENDDEIELDNISRELWRLQREHDFIVRPQLLMTHSSNPKPFIGWEIPDWSNVIAGDRREAQDYLRDVLTNFYEWYGLNGRPRLSFCALSDCDRLFIKAKTRKIYCGDKHQKLAWARENLLSKDAA